MTDVATTPAATRRAAGIPRLALGTISARTLLVGLMIVTLMPFVTMFSAALAPSGTYPPGLQWPADPQWQNFAAAFEAAHMDQLLWSSTLIALGVVPISVLAGRFLAPVLGTRVNCIAGRTTAGRSWPLPPVQPASTSSDSLLRRIRVARWSRAKSLVSVSGSS